MDRKDTMIAFIVCAAMIAVPIVGAAGMTDAQTSETADVAEYHGYSELVMPENISSEDYGLDDLAFGWFAHKNLKFECEWNDPSGLNWLLERAGIHQTISAIVEDARNIWADIAGTFVPLMGPTGGLVAALIELGLAAINVYEVVMQKNACEKADLASDYISQKVGYNVYETTVLWNAMPNGYEVEARA